MFGNSRKVRAGDRARGAGETARLGEAGCASKALRGAAAAWGVLLHLPKAFDATSDVCMGRHTPAAASVATSQAIGAAAKEPSSREPKRASGHADAGGICSGAGVAVELLAGRGGRADSRLRLAPAHAAKLPGANADPAMTGREGAEAEAATSAGLATKELPARGALLAATPVAIVRGVPTGAASGSERAAVASMMGNLNTDWPAHRETDTIRAQPWLLSR